MDPFSLDTLAGNSRGVILCDREVKLRKLRVNLRVAALIKLLHVLLHGETLFSRLKKTIARMKLFSISMSTRQSFFRKFLFSVEIL